MKEKVGKEAFMLKAKKGRKGTIIEEKNITMKVIKQREIKIMVIAGEGLVTGMVREIGTVIGEESGAVENQS